MLLRKAWFWIRNFTASNFEKINTERFINWKKTVRKVSDFKKKLTFKKHVLKNVTARKRHLLHFSSFRNHDFKFGNSRCVRFWKKIIQRVWFWIKRLKMCQKMKNVCIQKSRYESCYSIKATTFFVFSLLFEKHEFWLKVSRSVRLKIWRSFTKNQIFCLEILQIVWL